jgi:hypothetical protein
MVKMAKILEVGNVFIPLFSAQRTANVRNHRRK